MSHEDERTGEAENTIILTPRATEDASQATEDASQATGDASQATGDASQATGDASQATGDASQATGDASQATTGEIVGDAVHASMSPIVEDRYVELVSLIAKLRGKTEYDRVMSKFFGALLLVVIALAAVYWSNLTVFWSVAVVTLGLFFFLGYFGARGNIKQRTLEANELERQTAQLSRSLKVAGNDNASYFEQLVTINVTNLREYYLLVKNQTGNSFLASILAAVLGFILVAGSVVAALVSNQSDLISVIGVGSGILIEFISAIFFYLYSKTVRQLKEYHDSLLSVQNVLLALRLLETVREPGEQALAIRGIIDALVPKRS
jgi:uncharacterized protein YjbJ (UPF0337 family)